MKKVVITGSQGIIGGVLATGLNGYELTLAGLPDQDLRNYDSCLKLLESKDAVIHLAWNVKTENWGSGRILLTAVRVLKLILSKL